MLLICKKRREEIEHIENKEELTLDFLNMLLTTNVSMNDEKIGDSISEMIITYEDLCKLKSIDAVVKEVLRVRPATAMILCFSDNSDQIDNYKIPVLTQLVINIIGLHINPKYWEEPTKFNFSRFLSNNNKNNDTFNTNKNASINFGRGLCMCPGKQLAMIQLKLLVVLLYSKYKIEVLTKDPSTQNNINTQCNELKIRISCKS
ncbi:2534_t:CDS:2 [Gigaspora margarita]|uniref:2534_t:CDS:1 n=1 Tax=Gigaspora margarita TaxID=4874 RepID=A0ABN7UFT2_GIGMA|nr:2534_t:CDS:2 [Gigaspora margarita]